MRRKKWLKRVVNKRMISKLFLRGKEARIFKRKHALRHVKMRILTLRNIKRKREKKKMGAKISEIETYDKALT